MTYIDYIAITAEENAATAIREAELLTEDVEPQHRCSQCGETEGIASVYTAGYHNLLCPTCSNPCINDTFDDREPLQVEEPASPYNRADQALDRYLGHVPAHEYTIITEASITYMHCRRCGQEVILD